MIGQKFAMQYTAQLAQKATNFSSLMASAPQLAVLPISYTINNLIPFDIPVAGAVTFVGLIYLLILTFFLLVSRYIQSWMMMAHAYRQIM